MCLEVNPRASRTVPFVAKVIGLPVAKIASRVMAGEPLASFKLSPPRPAHVGVKEAVFPFAPPSPGRRHRTTRPEMRSTGEVMGDRPAPLRSPSPRARSAAGARLPRAGTVFVSMRDGDKERIFLPAGEAPGRARLQGDRDLGARSAI